MPVPDFSPGEIWTAGAADSIGMWLVHRLDFVNTTTIQVDNCFTSNFRNYLLMVSLGTHTQGTGGIDLRLRAGGVNTSTGNYNYQGVNQSIGGSVPSSNAAGASAFFYASNLFSADQSSTTFETKFFNPEVSTAHTAIHNSTFFYWDAATYYYRNSLGSWGLTGSFDGFSLIPSRAVTGRLRVYGLRD
jgi:hypothetical protein